MPSRRGGRWVFWPARILWLPALAAGIWALTGMQVDRARVDADTWRVLYTVSSPEAWFDPVWQGVLGIGLLLVGLVLTFAYFWEPGPYRPLTGVHYRIFSWAAILFAVLGGLAAVSLSGHVVEAGASGVDWRFLLTFRSQPLDMLLMAIGGAGTVLCYLASWGLRTPSWDRGAPEPQAD